MTTRLINNLREQLNGPRDGALLRFSLGHALLQAGQAEAATEHLQQAVALDQNYSAAWKLLGKALQASDKLPAAAEAWRHGIAAATESGHRQAAKEMSVFLRRVERQASDPRP